MGPAPDFDIDAMRADELAMLGEWAAGESWNPGLHDLALVWDFDPNAFIAVRSGNELIGGGSIVSYEGRFGFMGLFIVRPDLRGQGIGTRLWYHRRDRLMARLVPGSSIGMDGVFDMVPFYRRGGFALAYRDLRFEGIASGVRSAGLVPLDRLPFEQLDAFDRRYVAAPRSRFLSLWSAQPGAIGAARVVGGSLEGYGMIRRCRRGFKVGPLFAESTSVATMILGDLLAQIDGEFVQIDVPEPNVAGLELARHHGLAESFGCARMYLGPDPGLPADGIFGVTSFEFG